MPKAIFELSNLDGRNGFVIRGVKTGDGSGGEVASAGDINGDGIDDILIGAPSASPESRTGAGESYVVFGSPGAWPAALELSNLDGNNGFVIPGIDKDDHSGRGLSTAGDLNADGFGDIMIGANFADPDGRTEAGKVFLLFGNRTKWSSQFRLATLNGHRGVTIHGVNAFDHAGFSISCAGDFNGDAIDDVLIGAHSADPGNHHGAGTSYILFGNNGTWPTSFELSELDGSNGLILFGIDSEDYSGRALSYAGDINGDGLDDIIIGAAHADPIGRSNAGEIYLVFGSKTTYASGIELSALNGTNGLVIHGSGINHRSGASVSGGRDINSDGFDDIIIGTPYANQVGKINAGKSYVIYGRKTPWPSSIDLLDMDREHGFVIHGVHAHDGSGSDVSGAGDVSGDGINDILIGAPFADQIGRYDAGETYLVFGNSSTGMTDIMLSTLNGDNGITIHGISKHDRSGIRVSCAGDVNADGFDDAIIGAHLADPGGRIDAGESYVLFGGAERFSANHITLSKGDVVSLGAENLAVDPLINERLFTVLNVSHGYFALSANQSHATQHFTQGQINRGDVLFVHDGSDHTPSYRVTAEGITRIFSDVKPQSGQVTFLTTSTTTTHPSTTSATSQTLTHSDPHPLSTNASSTKPDHLTSSSLTLSSSTTPPIKHTPTITSWGLTTTSNTTPTTHNLISTEDPTEKNSNPTAAILGAIVAILCGIIVVGSIWFYRKTHFAKQQPLERANHLPDPHQSQTLATNPTYQLGHH